MVATSPEDFTVSRDRGFEVSGFTEKARGRLSGMQKGDQVVYYIKDKKSFGAIAKVSKWQYHEKPRIWAGEDGMFPLRVSFKLEVALRDDQLVDVRNLVMKLSFVADRDEEKNWGLAFHQVIREIPPDDFDLIACEIRRAGQPDAAHGE